MYATGPHKRSSNKLRFKFKLMENLELKDMVRNIDEDLLEKEEGKRSTNSKRTSTKLKVLVSKVNGLLVSKFEGLKMLAAVLNNLN